MNQQKIVWMALVMSSIIYVGIAYSLAPNPVLTFPESVAQSTALMVYGIAFVVFIMAMVVPSMLVSAPPRTRMLIAMAMFEACAIFGLIGAVLLKDWRIIVPAWIASMVGFLREYPRDEVSAPV